MDGTGQRISAVKASLPEGVTLVAVSKFHPAEAIMEAYGAGQRIFGESRATELVSKAKELPDDIEWHFIGHLQTNKVRAVMPYVTSIHSIDSERLLRLVNTEAARIGRKVDVLLQVHVAREETKFGFTAEEFDSLISGGILNDVPSVRIRGVMGMASNVDDDERIAADFRAIKCMYDRLAEALTTSDGASCDTLSMGMSHDYRLAIECGSNMVRIGTTIFGEREY